MKAVNMGVRFPWKRGVVEDRFRGHVSSREAEAIAEQALWMSHIHVHPDNFPFPVLPWSPLHRKKSPLEYIAPPSSSWPLLPTTPDLTGCRFLLV